MLANERKPFLRLAPPEVSKQNLAKKINSSDVEILFWITAASENASKRLRVSREDRITVILEAKKSS